MTSPEHPEPRGSYHARAVAHLDFGDVAVTVAHVFAAEGESGACHCGLPAHDPGNVGMTVTGRDGQGREVTLDLQATPEGALLLADRLARAANLALESVEDLPDMEREMARFGGRR